MLLALLYLWIFGVQIDLEKLFIASRKKISLKNKLFTATYSKTNFLLPLTPSRRWMVKFSITLKMLEYAKEKIGESDNDGDDGLLLMDLISQKIQNKKKLIQKDLKFLDVVGKGKEGRETMAQEVKNIQKNNQDQNYLDYLEDREILEGINKIRKVNL